MTSELFLVLCIPSCAD